MASLGGYRIGICDCWTGTEYPAAASGRQWTAASTIGPMLTRWSTSSSLEDALVRMVNAFQDLGTLVPMSQDLRDIEAHGRTAEPQPDGTAAFRMTISWSGAAAMALVVREEARKSAITLAERLA